MGTKTNTISYLSRYNTNTSNTNGETGISTYSELSTGSATAYTDTRTGVSNPKWRAAIKSGGDATTDMTGSRFRRLINTPFYVAGRLRGVELDRSTSNQSISGTAAESNIRPLHVSGTSLAKADTQAKIRALKNVSLQTSRFQGLTALGELRETIHMLKHPFQGARTYIDRYFKDLAKVRKGLDGRTSRTKQRDSFVAAASGAWLEVAFGLKPLMSDVKGAAEAIAHYQNDSRRSVVVGSGEDRAAETLTTSSILGSLFTLYFSQRDTTIQSVRYKVYMDYTRSADFNSNQRLREILGFTPEQFVPTVWELIPWSFLVDYFSNIGEVIAAGCTSQSTVKFVVRTQRLETIREQTFSPELSAASRTNPRISLTAQSVGETLSSRTDVSRSHGSLSITPSDLEFSLPGKPLQYVNMLALWGANSRSLTKGLRF